MKMQTPATPANTTPDPADIAIARDEARMRRQRRWLIVGGVVSLLIGYPLSSGPARMLLQSGLIPAAVHPLVHVVYLPLTWAYRNSEWIKAFLDWYLKFFIER